MDTSTKFHLWKYGRIVGFVVLLLAVFGSGFLLRGQWTSAISHDGHSKRDDMHAADKHGEVPQTTDAKMWTCSMHPQIRQPDPGNCPICGMKLIPVSSSGGGIRQITFDETSAKLMQIKTSPVEQRFVTATVRMVGKVNYDETKLKRITAWVGGRLDRLFVDFTGVPVKSGNHMVLIYSPELYSAQAELFQAIAFRKTGGRTTSDIDLVESSREKLRLYGMTRDQIKEIEKKGKPSYHLTIKSPIGGIVVEKHRNQGDYVRIGDKIYTIADLSHLWVQLDAYESDLEWIRYGQEVSFTTEAFPGEQFSGRIAFKDPILNEQTRTVKVRVNVPNKDGKLKPGMFVHGIVRSKIAAGGRVMDPSLAGKWISPMHPGVVKDEPGACPVCGMPLQRAESLGYVSADAGTSKAPLVVPKSAVLITGTRAIVYIEIPKTDTPTFEGREIVLGPRAGDFYLVRSGLKKGDMVVTNGNFKIDSALQIQAKPSMMTPEGGGSSGHDHGGHGNKKGKIQSDSKQKTKLPAQFQKQLAVLEKSYEHVVRSFETDELTNVRESFAKLGKSLHQVDRNLLTKHPKMLWSELADLLHNDVVEGHNAQELKHAKSAFRQLKDHMRRVRQQFQHGTKTQEVIVSPEFRSKLGDLWKAYLPLQNALARDNLSTAQQAIPQLTKSLRNVNSNFLPEKARTFWIREQKQMATVIEKLSKAKDIKTIREDFSLLSGSMIAAIRTFGIRNVGTVYEMHCSMARGNRGASWLQSDKTPRNPYFGAAMPACVSRVQLIAGREEKKQTEGHEHHE